MFGNKSTLKFQSAISFCLTALAQVDTKLQTEQKFLVFASCL